MAHIDYEAADAYSPDDVLGFIEEDLGNIADPLKKLPKLAELYQQLADCLEVKDLREHAEATREWLVELTEVRDLLKKIKALLPKMQREFDALMAGELKGKLVAELEALPTVTPLCELGKKLETIVLKMKDEATPDPAPDVVGNYIYSDCGVFAKFEKLELSFEASDLSGDIMVAGLLAGYLFDLREAFEDEDEES
jgi:acyl-CoA reductase-like NAD-dependent aldehyde dehydrogenase